MGLTSWKRPKVLAGSGQGSFFFFLKRWSTDGDARLETIRFARSPVCLVFLSSFASTSDVHSTQRMAGDRGRRGGSVIRGLRPPSVRWPQAQSSHRPEKVVRNVSAAAPEKGGDRSNQGRWRQGRSRISPDVALENARKRDAGLEAAITAMIANGAEVTSLQVSLTKAKRNAQEASPRARKRLAAHHIVEEELAEGQGTQAVGQQFSKILLHSGFRRFRGCALRWPDSRQVRTDLSGIRSKQPKMCVRRQKNAALD